jgi:hypothetical protein
MDPAAGPGRRSALRLVSLALCGFCLERYEKRRGSVPPTAGSPSPPTSVHEPLERPIAPLVPTASVGRVGERSQYSQLTFASFDGSRSQSGLASDQASKRAPGRAWRSPPARGVAARCWVSTLRAAGTAWSASVLPPERRSRRNLPTSAPAHPHRSGRMSPELGPGDETEDWVSGKLCCHLGVG